MPKQEKPLLKNRLREHRVHAGMSQDKVAKELGISFVTVSRHETGHNGLSRDMAVKYAKLYGVAAAELYINLETVATTQD